jgi:hypothetical protein
MDPFFKDAGKTINQMEMVEELAQMARFIRGNGLITKCKEKECFLFKMEHPILVNG